VPAISRFLPADFSPQRPIALLAGQGLYPIRTAAAIRRAGIPLRLVGFEEETAPELVQSFPEAERRIIRVGQLGHMLDALKDFKVGYALMAGQITPRRLFRGLHPDWKAARILFSLKRRNAETIFGALAKEIADIGVTLLDARSFLDDELASPGPMTGRFSVPEEFIAHGIHIAKEVARLDIGQGVVVRKGTVVAVEAFEGTDSMLRRAGEFQTDHLVFVKTVKPGQDYRFDVPVFGMRTLESMRAAGIEHAALEADNTIILEKPKVLEQARAWKIQLFGYS
jgi:DUF1009 family protein